MSVWDKLACMSAWLALASCAMIKAPPPVERMPFPEAEYAGLATEGSAVVRGQAFLKTRGGDVKTAAGEEVLLNPVTSYSEQWYRIAYLGGRTLTKPDSRYIEHMQRTTADSDGRFVFTNVPAGEYFVVARIVWEVATGYGLVPQGGFVAKRVLVGDASETEVIVTR